MQNNRRQSGLTLTELLVTVAVMAILMGLAVPAAKRLTASLQAGAGTHGLISAALNNARAIAVREGTYAGLWFHRAGNRTYMIFIVHDDRAISAGGTGLAFGFRPVDGRKAIALPEGTAAFAEIEGTESVYFPIVFNAAGRLVTHPVRYRGRLPIQTPPGSYDSGGTNIPSVNRFYLFDHDDPTTVRTLMVSPYTGELVGR